MLVCITLYVNKCQSYCVFVGVSHKLQLFERLISALYRIDNITLSTAPNLHAIARGAPKFRYFRVILTLCTVRQTRDVLVAVSLVTRVLGSADTCLFCAALWPALLWQPSCVLYGGKAV